MHFNPPDLYGPFWTLTTLIFALFLAARVYPNAPPPKPTALIASHLQERIRDGSNSVAELMQYGKMLLGRRHVLPSVSHLVH
jgi:hypothetical protein